MRRKDWESRTRNAARPEGLFINNTLPVAEKVCKFNRQQGSSVMLDLRRPSRKREMSYVVFRMVLFFGAFLLTSAIDTLGTSARAQAPTWQWQQGQRPNQYTSHTVDNSALVKEPMLTHPAGVG
jgi:hypothetical protein